MRLRHAKMAEQIDVLFGVKTPGCPINIALDGCTNPSPATGSAGMLPIVPYIRGGEGFNAAFVKLLSPLVFLRLRGPHCKQRVKGMLSSENSVST